MKGLYSISPTLQISVRQARERVYATFQNEMRLVEYITLPEAGQHVVLRFAVRKRIFTLDEMDELENALARLVGEEFWAVLVGETYSHAAPPLPLTTLPVQLEKVARAVSDIPLPVASTPYAPRIKQDGQIVRAGLPLESNDWVWEVEAPSLADKSPPVVRIVSEKPRDEQMATFGDQEFLIEYMPRNESYVGLVKIYPLARQAGRSLVRYIFEHADDGWNQLHV